LDSDTSVSNHFYCSSTTISTIANIVAIITTIITITDVVPNLRNANCKCLIRVGYSINKEKTC
jgi:hypothetical protein